MTDLDTEDPSLFSQKKIVTIEIINWDVNKGFRLEQNIEILK